MNSTSLDYAFQKPELCRADITLSNDIGLESISGDVERKTNSTLVVRFKSGQLHVKLPAKASVHFEYAHWKFKRLHCAIDYAKPELIKRLVEPGYISIDNHQILPILLDQIDNEYQPVVLKKVLNGGQGSPFLLLGPFGTGKTHLLGIATVSLTLENAGGRILICTHLNRGADTISKRLTLEPSVGYKVLRLYSNINEASKEHEFCSASAPDLKISQFCPYSILVTTFTTALKLSERVDVSTELQFSHIIIDEGAQSMEPETLGALLMATPNTCLIIAGDNKQVCFFYL